MAKRNQSNRRDLSHISGGLSMPPLTGNLILTGGHFSVSHKNPYMMLRTSNPGARTVFRIQEETIDLYQATCHKLVGSTAATSTIYTSSMVIPRYSRIDALSVRINETFDQDESPRYISQIGITGTLGGVLKHGSTTVKIPNFFFSASSDAPGAPYPQDMILSQSGQRAVYYPWNPTGGSDLAATTPALWSSASFNQFLHTASAPVCIAFETNKTGSTRAGNFSFCLHYTTYGAPFRSGSTSLC